MGLEYQDQADKLNAVAERVEEEAVPAEQWSEDQLPPFEDARSEAVSAALRDVLTGLGLPDGQVTAATLRQAHAVLESQVLPALADPSAAAGAPAAAEAAAVLRQYPLGFSTGAEATDAAATILRMLYIRDLRALQTQVDESIVQAQVRSIGRRRALLWAWMYSAHSFVASLWRARGWAERRCAGIPMSHVPCCSRPQRLCCRSLPPTPRPTQPLGGSGDEAPAGGGASLPAPFLQPAVL